MCVFGVVVAWSIYISGKKAFQLRREEKAKELADKGEYMEMTDDMAMDESAPPRNMETTATAVNADNTS